VQRPDHRLELGDLLAPLAAGGVFIVRGEKADRVITPVVPQPPLDQVGVVNELMDIGNQSGPLLICGVSVLASAL